MVDRNSPQFTAMLAAADREYAHQNVMLDQLVATAAKSLGRMSPIEATALLGVDLLKASGFAADAEFRVTVEYLAAAVVRLAQQQDLKVENETLTALLNDARARNKQLAAELDDASRSWFHRVFRTSKA